MNKIKVKCPAKINLTLEVLNKRKDGFHNIQSVMQAISLYDFLTVSIEDSDETKITLSGTSDKIPYNEKNLVYKACELFCKQVNKSYKIDVFIEKNIPVEAGLAGGSTDGAGTFFALNELTGKTLNKADIHTLCAKLGSDLNFCLEGGCKLATGRGEKLKNLPFHHFKLSLIKPKNFGISAKEAYTKFSQLKNKPNLNITKRFIDGERSLLHNDLELAVINDYADLQKIKSAYPQSQMSGSGPTFFLINENAKLDGDFLIIPNIEAISDGVKIA